MDWERLFASRILDRGYDYYYDGAVEDLKYSDKCIRAHVQGTEDYEVEITLDDGEIVDMDCSCPYAADGHHCKHMAAVLYEWSEAKDNEIEEATKNTSSSGGNDGYIGNFEGKFSWPISSNTPYYNYISSYFGKRPSPTSGASSNHGAIDIPVSYAPVYSAANGRIVSAGWMSGYGNYIEIDHGNGYYTAYAHLSSFNVSAGDIVSRGEQIAVSGNTGISTGSHLHFEVYIGGLSLDCRVDPLQYTSHPQLYSL